jgi:hypothetical protein
MVEWKKGLLLAVIFLAIYFIPFEDTRVKLAISEAFLMLQEYAREHVLFCLVPAFFIAGAMSAFINKDAIIKYFGARTRRWISYSIASISGAVLAVCSCTVLPLFAGIYMRGAGMGPAIAFLYSGPAINVLAIILTTRILGWKIGFARAIGAIFLSVIIGLLMSIIFRRGEIERIIPAERMSSGEERFRPAHRTFLYLLNLVLILIFAAWGKSGEPIGFWNLIHRIRWYIIGILLLALAIEIKCWFRRGELGEWMHSTWGFAKQILPLLFGGVLAAGVLMGRPETDTGLIPSRYIGGVVGGNSMFANLMSSLVGALMYFATLTEIPILQGLLGNGMGYGPALALLLAGPALSLPNMLVIRSIIGTRRALTFILLVVITSALTGKIFGIIMGGV